MHPPTAWLCSLRSPPPPYPPHEPIMPSRPSQNLPKLLACICTSTVLFFENNKMLFPVNLLMNQCMKAIYWPFTLLITKQSAILDLGMFFLCKNKTMTSRAGQHCVDSHVHVTSCVHGSVFIAIRLFVCKQRGDIQEHDTRFDC